MNNNLRLIAGDSVMLRGNKRSDGHFVVSEKDIETFATDVIMGVCQILVDLQEAAEDLRDFRYLPKAARMEIYDKFLGED